MTASDADIIRWQFRCLEQVHEEMTEAELNLIISFEDQFEEKGHLSPKQMTVLEDIYKRRT